VNYDNIDHETNAGTYVLQVDSDNLKDGYFIRKIYRNGETYGSGPGTDITNYGRHIISPADLSIVVNNQTKTYGDLFSWEGSEFLATGLVNSETIENLIMSSGGATETASVLGGPYTISGHTPTGTGFTATNYNITYTTGTLTVTPAPLDLILSSASKIFGVEGDTQTTQFVANGLKNLDAIDHVTIVSAGLPASAALGAYSMEAKNPFGVSFDATNYAIHYSDAILTVFAPNDETIHDVWTRSNLISTTLPQSLNASNGGGMTSSRTGRSSVEISVPGQEGELSGNGASQPNLDETAMPSQQPDDQTGV
ncbi:MAG: MBG domain-containing protein, partial [Rhodopirellula sp. JB055]|uniref:MBG domain-containing protein n=1 Tax=Rhodopirellula sp. JB055 TaxID=3342846 RepID=UPI00370C53D6